MSETVVVVYDTKKAGVEARERVLQEKYPEATIRRVIMRASTGGSTALTKVLDFFLGLQAKKCIIAFAATVPEAIVAYLFLALTEKLKSNIAGATFFIEVCDDDPRRDVGTFRTIDNVVIHLARE